jgi:hypothetical protein
MKIKARLCLKAKQIFNSIHTYALPLLVCAVIVISLLAIFSNLIGLPINSDDVAEQTLAHDLTLPGPHNLQMQIDTYALKFPVYLLFNFFFHPSADQVIAEAVLFNLIMIGLLWLWLMRLNHNKRTVWLVCVWLLSTGTYWMTYTVNPNVRNIELPLMLLLVFFILKRFKVLDKGFSIRSFVTDAVLMGIITGLLLYNDPYILFFCLLPLEIVVLISAMMKSGRAYAALFVTTIITIGMIVFRVLWVFLSHHGLSLTKYNEITDLSSSVIKLSYLPDKTVDVIKDYISLFGLNFTKLSDPLRIIAGLWELCILGLIVLPFYRAITHRRFTVFSMWMISVFIFTFAYIIVVGTPLYNTARYLIILVPLTALLAARGLDMLRNQSRFFYKVIVIVICLSILTNIAVAVTQIYNQAPNTKPNLVDYRLTTVIKRNRIKVAYGNYWLANLTYFLSDYQDNVLPTVCYSGVVYKDSALLDNERFNVSAGKSAVIASPDLVIPANSPYPQSPSCTVAATIKQFGRPQKNIRLSSSVSLLIYNHPLNLQWRPY